MDSFLFNGGTSEDTPFTEAQSQQISSLPLLSLDLEQFDDYKQSIAQVDALGYNNLYDRLPSFTSTEFKTELADLLPAPSPAAIDFNPDTLFGADDANDMAVDMDSRQEGRSTGGGGGEEEKKNKKRIAQPLPVSDPERVWKTVFSVQNLVKEGDVQVYTKTRCEQPDPCMPDRLYSSLKYEIRMDAKGQFLQTIPFLHSKCVAVYADTFEEIKDESNSVLKGVIEGALTHPASNKNSDSLYGQIRIQFNPKVQLSFHHTRKEVCLEMRFFLPNDLLNPILTKRSASFKLFARKPTLQVEKEKEKKSESMNEDANKKRKKVCKAEEAEEPPKKKAAVQQQQPAVTPPPAIGGIQQKFSLFENQLNDLVRSYSERLDPCEKKFALQMILTKFLTAETPPPNPSGFM